MSKQDVRFGEGIREKGRNWFPFTQGDGSHILNGWLGEEKGLDDYVTAGSGLDAYLAGTNCLESRIAGASLWLPKGRKQV